MSAEFTSQTWMIDAAIRGTVLVALALTANALLSRTSASLRHRVLTSALCCLLALPALVIVVPPWHVEVLPASLAATAGAVDAGEPAATDVAEARSGVVARVDRGSDVEPATLTSTSQAGGSAPEEGSDNVLAVLFRGAAARFDLARAALAVWLLGAVVLLLKLARGVGAAWWTARGSTLVKDPAWNRSVRVIADQLGLKGHVRLLRNARVNMPMAWGLRRPVVLLPAAADRWSPSRRHAVLAHEIAHLRRRDCAALLVTRIVTALYWFSPLVWIAAAQQAAQRERACDDAVIRTGTDRAEYAEHLLAIARAAVGSRDPGWAVVTMARRSQLEGRLLAVLDPRRDRRHASRLWGPILSLTIVALLLPLAAFRPAVGQPAVGSLPATEEPVSGSSQQEQPESEDLASPVVSSTEHTETRSSERAETSAASAPSAEQPQAGEASALPGSAAAATAETVASQEPEPAPRVEARPSPRSLAGQEARNPERAARRQRVLDTMARILRDEDPEMREQAAHSLGEMEDSAAVPALADALATEAEASVREQIAWALGMIESPDAVPALSSALSDGNVGVREQAAWALGMIEDPAAVDALTRALGDSDVGVREQAVWALGMIESSSALPGLIAALADSDADIREQAAWALGMIESSDAVDGLVELLRTESEAAVREQVVWALGMIEDERALDALIDAVEDEDESVRKQALWALSQIVG